MAIVYRNRLRQIKAEVAGKRACRFSGKAVAEMDRILEKEVAAILRAAFLHTQSRKQLTITPTDLKCGFFDYRATFVGDMMEQVQGEFNNLFEEIKERSSDKNECRKSYLESSGQEE